MRFASHNPVYRNILNSEFDAANYEAATYRGVAGKTLYFIIVLLIGAFGGLYLFAVNPALAQSLLTVAIFSTFILAIIAMLAPKTTRVIGTLYCLSEGMLVGFVSLLYNIAYPGTVLVALFSTILVLVVVATLYLTNLVKVNGKFMRFLSIFAISMFISLIFLLIFNKSLGNNLGVYFLVSALMIFLATLYLFMDLENIRRVVEGGAPKYLEWYASFGLVFTIVWLYIEILPIIARIMGGSRD